MILNHKNIIKKSEHDALSEDEMTGVMTAIMGGNVADEDIAALLTHLAQRMPSVDEITGAARVLRAKADTITAPDGAIDCCGTGGDGLSTYNVSTAVALIAAGCGVPIAKHGNRAVSSKAGAADTLEALGVNLNVTFQEAETALHTYNFAFLMAPHHHKAMKHVSHVRKKLGFRTIFNILGPLANPANTKRQLIGVYDEQLLPLMTAALERLGTAKAWIVHGSDGLDEITITGTSSIQTLDHGKTDRLTFDPNTYGIAYSPLQSIQGGNAQENAAALKALLEGKLSPYRDIALLNSAGVLMLSDKANSIEQAIDIAKTSIDSGAALKTLEAYMSFTQKCEGSQ